MVQFVSASTGSELTEIDQFMTDAGTPLRSGMPLAQFEAATGARVRAHIGFEADAPLAAVVASTPVVEMWKLSLRDEDAAAELVDTVLCIDQITVRADLRGHGIGRSILADFEDTVRESSIRYLVGTVSPYAGPMRFFRGAGFTVMPPGGQTEVELTGVGTTIRFGGIVGTREVWKRVEAAIVR
jgi:GNAT superfamily N-acetyltransferase